ncbi:hypothetical protein RND81_02G006600 [Saponaria officinalis]|uniref:Transmembrane protein n=1 Tax=Saponaria officinalis TaxID=3572 RepID=A0AAW1MMA4_SAPOF
MHNIMMILTTQRRSLLSNNNSNFIIIIFIISLIIIINFDQIEAMRPIKEELLLLESLPKGSTTPSKSNPCTNIPKSGGKGHCAFLSSEMHFSGVTRTVNVAPAATKDHI